MSLDFNQVFRVAESLNFALLLKSDMCKLSCSLFLDVNCSQTLVLPVTLSLLTPFFDQASTPTPLAGFEMFMEK
jgi:hypothetical protein